MSQLSTDQQVGVFRFTITRLVTAAVLVALTIVLSFVAIPVPNVTGSATVNHIPTILGSVLEGPVVGGITGLLFGLLSMASGIVPFTDPLVSVLPRILIGITPWLAFMGVMRGPFGFLGTARMDVAAGLAGLVGSATNTVFVLGIAVLRGYFTPAIFLIALPQATAEAILAIVITIVVTRAMYIIRNRVRYAPERKNREELPY